MSDNPYQAPREAPPVVGVRGDSEADLRTVARCQKWITLCLVVYVPVWVLAISCQAVMPSTLLFLLGALGLGAALAGAFFVCRAGNRSHPANSFPRRRVSQKPLSPRERGWGEGSK